MKICCFNLILIQLTLLPLTLLGQDVPPTCKIATLARYTPAGTELKWIPDNKTILRLGFATSYTIERSESPTGKFTVIDTAKAYEKAVWDTLISRERDTVAKRNLAMAFEFLFIQSQVNEKGISLEAGIGELNDQKGKEDMMYSVLVLSAIKDSNVAGALGLGYLDKTVTAGKTYTYRVKLNGTSNIYTIVNGTVTIKTIPDPDLYKNEVFVYPGDKKLSFAWASKPEVSGFFVERAAPGETVFKPLNSIPVYAAKGSGYEGPVNGSYTDDSLTNYKTYRYRFYGNTAFGEKVLFAEAKGIPRDLTPPQNPMVSQPKHIKPKEVLVTWDEGGDLGELRGFMVGRSDRDTGNFEILHKQILPAKTRNFTDSTFIEGGINYYVVYAMDTSGNISSSYPAYVALIDSTPPAQPKIKSAVIDSLGVVTLTLIKGKEKDLKGYRLFKANSPEHEFSVFKESFRQDKSDTTSVTVIFSDTITLQSLTPKIFYRVKALDFNYNQSAFSDIMAVARPDTIAPVSPVFTDILVKENKVILHFVPSESSDVTEHQLYRKTDLAEPWTLQAILNGTLGDAPATSYIDTLVTTGVTYYYSIRALDESHNFSAYANPVYGKPYDTGIRPPVEKFSGGKQDQKIVLTWDYPQTNREVYFVIYKKNGKGEMVRYSTTSEKSFSDSVSGREQFYSIKAMTTDGGHSRMSQIINVL